MASIHDIKAGLAASAQEGHSTVWHTQVGMANADKMIAQLQVVARGSTHPKVQEAMVKAQQCKQRLTEAAALALAATQSAHDYIGILG